MLAGRLLPSFRNSSIHRKWGLPLLRTTTERTLRLWRHACTVNENDGDSDDVPLSDARLLNDEDIYKEIFLGDDGKPIFELDRTKPLDENYDWIAFEKAFGIDKLHDIDFEKWEPLFCSNNESSLDDTEIDNFDGSIDKTSRIVSRLHASNAQNESESRIDSATEKYFDGHENEQQIDSVIQSALMGARRSSTPKAQTSSDVPGKVAPPREFQIQNKEDSSVFEDGPTKKLGRIQRNSKRLSKRSSIQVTQPHRQTGKGTRLENIVDSFNINDALRVPRNTQKPGYERRIRGLEFQMERIATELLCGPGHEFHDAGATMRHVLLAPDGFTLSVYYDLDDASNEFKRRKLSAWSSRVAGQVRAELAKRLHTKRVPVVKLFKLTDETKVSAVDKRDKKVSEKRQLDALFAQIAAEREESSSRTSS